MYPFFETNLKHIFISRSGEFPAHFHNNLEMVYCFEGTQKIKIGETTYVLGKRDAAIIFPNTVHEYMTPPSDANKCIALICDINLLSQGIPYLITKKPVNPMIDAEKVSDIASNAFEKMTETNSDIALIGWTFVVLSELLKTIDCVPSDADLNLPSLISSYINTNFKEPLTIKYIASKFGYHPSYIAHLFCNQLKVPFRTYLGSVRSEYAATQIKTTDKSLTEIAFDCGYNSLNTFCRCFKKHFSMTPTQYKKEYK